MADASKHQGVREREKTNDVPLYQAPGASKSRYLGIPTQRNFLLSGLPRRDPISSQVAAVRVFTFGIKVDDDEPNSL